jgi:hypothetical protein
MSRFADKVAFVVIIADVADDGNAMVVDGGHTA